eukprot:8333827-Pyramimonas_sp.AAC.1
MLDLHATRNRRRHLPSDACHTGNAKSRVASTCRVVVRAYSERGLTNTECSHTQTHTPECPTRALSGPQPSLPGLCNTGRWPPPRGCGGNGTPRGWPRRPCSRGCPCKHTCCDDASNPKPQLKSLNVHRQRLLRNNAGSFEKRKRSVKRTYYVNA